MSPEQPFPRMELHGPLHGSQACLEFNSFHRGLGQICPREGIFRAVPSQNGDNFRTSPPTHSLNNSALGSVSVIERRLEGKIEIDIYKQLEMGD